MASILKLFNYNDILIINVVLMINTRLLLFILIT